jgi:pimeloyl-ACP methyl ester carboxylesterase
MNIFERLKQLLFNRPPQLARVVDSGRGTPVILLHGIGKTNIVWSHVIEGLEYFPVRAVAFDLLGFGASPKPEAINYDADDHAAAVIASIEKLHSPEPCIIVGHSMGCLIAVRVAKLRPDLVRHLVLYEMPLYSGLPEKRVYRLRLNIYTRFYAWVINYQPVFNAKNDKRAQKLAKRLIGFEVNSETWVPFVKSLENTIMKQTTADDIKGLKVPMDVIYGTLDMFVIRGKPELIFGNDSSNITSLNVRAKHVISTKASNLIVQRVIASLNNTSARQTPVNI